MIESYIVLAGRIRKELEDIERLLSPAVGALLMSVSTIVVAIN